MTPLDVNTMFLMNGPPLLVSRGQRRLDMSNGLNRVLDTFNGAECLFIRTDAAMELRLTGNYALQCCVAGGWLLLPRGHPRPTFWIPFQPTLLRGTPQGHILEAQPAAWNDINIDADGISLHFSPVPAGWMLDLIIWRLNDAALATELSFLAPVEAQGYFLLGSHTRYGKPADLYRHIVHGSVYEDRYAWPHKRRICSENDAHALHVIFSGLQQATGKRTYGVLKAQLLLSILSRQGQDGGFRHGEWTDEMESHYRLHCSGMHLMMDALAEHSDPTVHLALERAAAFLAKQTDRTDLGHWFLHDELEHRPETMDKSPFRWLPGSVFSKSKSNMLVLNTHLDATIALDRYQQLTGDDQYAALIASARTAAVKVMALRPAERLYRWLFLAIGLTLLPTPVAKDLSLPKRALKRVAWKYLIPMLPAIKTHWPRLVMPGGYIDREVSLKVWAYDYHSVNVMDLLRFLRRFPDENLWRIADRALRFGQESGLRERWLEQAGRRYALGFWAEALYQCCLLRPDRRYRQWLTDTLLMLHDRNIGLPPSLLGANAEAIAPECQAPCPPVPAAGLIVVNLSRAEQREILMVNATSEPVSLAPDLLPRDILQWSLIDDGDEERYLEHAVVPARRALAGRALSQRPARLSYAEATCASA